MDAPVFVRYPRTPHLVGSALQAGDDPRSVGAGQLRGRHLVIEEKIDGAQAGLRFDAAGNLWLQSRGHFLVGGARERHFEQLKVWASVHQLALREVLGDRYILFGEWMAAKHSVFYDVLPHLFLEFDAYDTATGTFLSTPARRQLLDGVPVVSVPVLFTGALGHPEEIADMVAPSLYKSRDWRHRLIELAVAHAQDPERVLVETDPSDLAEGLYVKIEDDEAVSGRCKWVRPGFVNHVLEPNGAPSVHWLERPHLPNLCAEGVDLFAPLLTPAMAALHPGQVAL